MGSLGVQHVDVNHSKSRKNRHYLLADSVDATKYTGASNISLGYFHKLDKKAQIYLAYSATDNDSHASFQGGDGGHGDEVKTEAGCSPSSISAGMVFSF